MARLIDADDTMDKLRAYADRKHEAGHTELANGILKAVNYIHNEVRRVDASPVVRCKDCKHAYLTYDGEVKYCEIFDKEEAVYLPPSFFCAYGERRNNEH